MSILGINALALDLVARDFSHGHAPSNGGPTKTSRALAMIHLAAHDAYAQVSLKLTPQPPGKVAVPAGLAKTEVNARAALAAAALHVCRALYPDEMPFIDNAAESLTFEADPAALAYGEKVGQAWIVARTGDGSDAPLSDRNYKQGVGDHRADPLDPGQSQHGPAWGKVTPFILTNVATDAPLAKYPKLTTKEYYENFREVKECGKADLPFRTLAFRRKAAIGIFWGYDGANRLGTPPRLYLQVIRSLAEFGTAKYEDKVRLLAGCATAMADAGIAAWHWKYEYNLWRPVVGIREADAGWGPSGDGDQNPFRLAKKLGGDPFWLPLGAPRSNPHPGPSAGTGGANVTPNFPAYPSGHSTFASACFGTAAKILGKSLASLNVKFVSDEFNGRTTDNTGAMRPKWEQEISLAECMKQNEDSRVYLGVHWRFDSTAGAIVGKAIAAKVGAAF